MIEKRHHHWLNQIMEFLYRSALVIVWTIIAGLLIASFLVVVAS